MRAATLVAGLVLLVPGCTPVEAPRQATVPLPAWFAESAAASGIAFSHVSGHAGRRLFPEIIGSGAALFDMDGDGDLDAYIVQSGRLSDVESEAQGNKLFRNDGSGRFTDVTAGSGAGDRGYGMGVIAGDYDNDRDVDLYVTNVGRNTLLQNDGRGVFVDRTEFAGVGHMGWGTSGAFLDYDNDGDLDLFFTNYVNWSERIEQTCYNRSGLVDYCLPTNYNAPGIDVLYRNDGGGRFTDVSDAVGLPSAYGNGLGVVAGDFDADGWQDIFVANDTMLNQLWINQAGTKFRNEALLRGCALDEHGKAKAGMGVAVGDPDDDGDEDLIVVNLSGQTDSIFRNEAGYFEDATGDVGLGQTSRWYTRFGVGLVDFDNDGYLDLYEANGRVALSAEPETQDPYAEPNVLFRGLPGGRFELVLPLGGTAEPLVATSRGAAFGDVDGDGGVDVLIVNRDGAAHLLRNTVPARGNWAGLRIVDRHGRDALGATVHAVAGGRTQTRSVRAAYSYCSSNDPRVHLGLGAAQQVDTVEVRWLGGARETFGPFAAGRHHDLVQGTGR